MVRGITEALAFIAGLSILLFVIGVLYEIHDEIKLMQYRVAAMYDKMFPEVNGRGRCR